MKQTSITPVLFLTLGWFGIQMAMALDTTQFQVMLDSQVGNAFIIGLVLSQGPIAGVTVQPLIGWYGDALAKRGISRSLLMKVGLLLGLASLMVLSLPLNLWALVATIGVFFVGFNILMVSYRAITTETSSRRALKQRKGVISGFVALFSGLGSCTMFVLCGFVGGTPWPFWIAGGLLIVTTLLFFRFAPKARPQKNGAIEQRPSRELFAQWNLLFYGIPFLGLLRPMEGKMCKDDNQLAIFRLFVVMFFAWLGTQALRGYFVLYAEKALHFSQSLANLLLALLAIMMVLAAVPVGKLADRYENRSLLRGSLICFAGVCFCSYFFVGAVPAAVVMCVLLGICFAGMVVLPLTMLFKLCPPQQEGVYAGLYNLFMSIPQLYSLLLTGWLIELCNDYRVIMLVGGTAILIAVLTTFRLKPVPSFRKLPAVTEEPVPATSNTAS